jgi:hypothetical protein
MDKSFKEILNDIKCGKLASPAFTEDDLAKVKACIPEPIAQPAKEVNVSIPSASSCVNEGLDQIKKILVDQLSKQGTVIELGTIKGKVEEALDHYKFISAYYKARVEFFTSTISKVEPLTSQYLYWTDEYTRTKAIEDKIVSDYNKDYTEFDYYHDTFNLVVDLTDANFKTITTYNSDKLNYWLGNNRSQYLVNNQVYKNYYIARNNRIFAEESQTLSKQGASNSLSQSIQSFAPLEDGPIVLANLTQFASNLSGQLLPTFLNTENAQASGLVTPARTAAFSIRLIDLDYVKLNVPSVSESGETSQVEKTISIRNSPYLKNSPFSNSVATNCFSIVFEKYQKNRDYDFIDGALYSMTPSGYKGLYRKLGNPISNLYTPEERGLTVDPTKIDPLIKNVENAPVSLTEGDTKFYISNQETYSAFYDTVNKSLPTRIKKEKEEIFPAEIASSIKSLVIIAQREVADFFRRTTDSAIKLARPTSYRAGKSSIYTQGKFKYSKLDTVISQRLAYYQKAYDEVTLKIGACQKDLDSLEILIKENSMDSKVLETKISKVKCFSDAAKAKAVAKDCEAATLAKLGKDPLFIRTLGGTDSTLPDMNNPCYWREFAKALNKVSILPIPDLTSPLFRYYPINNIIPTPYGVVMIPMPQKWSPLFTLSTPLGTIVTFITMPVAIVGIPLPSVYVLYIAPDGRKYMLVAPNIPFLLIPGGSKIGFEVDNSPASQNPLGINPSDPFKGQLTKGSLSIPITISAKSSKAVRVASIAAAIALGKGIDIKNGAGAVLGQVDPTTYLSKYTGLSEKLGEALDMESSNDFTKQVNEFKRSINKQFDRLGEMQISALTKLKEKTRNERESKVMGAEAEENLAKKRETKKKARSLDPITLQSKIDGVLTDFNKYIDKIKLGTISFPNDPTKLNPPLPGAVTGMQPIIEQAAKGELNIDKDSVNFIAKIRRMAAQVDTSKLKSKKSFNLNKQEDIVEFKKAIKEYSKEAMDYLQGLKSPADDIDPNLSAEEKAKIAKASALRKERLKSALAFTSLSLISPSLKLFDPFAPCCSTEQASFELPASPQILAAIAIFNSLLDAVLSGLTVDSLKALLGDSLSNIGISSISSLFDSILSAFPPIALPNKADLVAISQAMLIPVLTALHIPQAPNPLGLPFPIQVSIPLDALIKPLLKSAVAYLLELILRMLADAANLLTSGAGSAASNTVGEILRLIPCGNSQTATVTTTSASKYVTITLPNGFKLKLPKIPMIPLDIVSYFSLLTSTDLVELIRSLINTAIDGILQPVQSIVEPILGLTKSLKDLSFNIIESANPYILPIKLIIMALQLQIPDSTKVRLANLDAMALVEAAYIPVITATEPAVKEIAYLGAILACSFGSKPGVQLARIAASPFFNQDDLPPWERLTHKNPLFAIFLDELAWKSSLLSTGSLIFQTKMPGLYPSVWTPNVFIDPGIHTI